MTSNDFKFGNADGVIVRRPGVTPSDIIVFKKAKVTAEALEAALDQLAVLRAIDGDVPTRAGTYRINDASRTKPKPKAIKDRDEGFARSALSLLDFADKRKVDGIGLGEYVELRPRKRASVTAKKGG